jgi:hypothetical protein
MKVLIELAKKQVNLLKIQAVKDLWLVWIQEIESFSQLPGYMTNLYKFKDIQKVLSDLILRTFEFKAV